MGNWLRFIQPGTSGSKLDEEMVTKVTIPVYKKIVSVNNFHCLMWHFVSLFLLQRPDALKFDALVISTW